MAKIELVPVTVQPVRVRYNWKNVKRNRKFFSRQEAIGRVAWWMILDGRGTIAVEEIAYPTNLGIYDFKPPKHLDCDCEASMHAPRWEGCEVHNRQTGYYTRLHRRLVRWLSATEKQS